MDWDKYNCERKRRYAKQSTAASVRKRMIRRDPRVTAAIQVYECNVCTGFHIGNPPKGGGSESPR